jgi:phosphohistidine phosphatase SixA
MKTIILCRHAESNENVKIRAFKDGMSRLGEWSLPSTTQVAHSVSLLKCDLDQTVSANGKQQIQKMAQILKKDNFLLNFQPELICYSSLQRAKETCHGLFGKRENDIELKSLKEMSPAEIFLFNNSVHKRIREFEDWLDSREEERIIAVGHSRYFKVMLNADEVMDNCSVIKCNFLPRSACRSMDDKDVSGSSNRGDSEASRWVVDEVLYTLSTHSTTTTTSTSPPDDGVGKPVEEKVVS